MDILSVSASRISRELSMVLTSMAYDYNYNYSYQLSSLSCTIFVFLSHRWFELSHVGLLFLCWKFRKEFCTEFWWLHELLLGHYLENARTTTESIGLFFLIPGFSAGGGGGASFSMSSSSSKCQKHPLWIPQVEQLICMLVHKMQLSRAPWSVVWR